MSTKEDVVKNDSMFNHDIKRLLKGKTKAFAVSGNSFVRHKIYEYCKENDLKYTRSRGKVPLVICSEHKCICKEYSGEWCHHVYGDGSTCLSCNYYCPKKNEDPDGCSIDLYRPKQPIIYIHQEDFTLNELNTMKIQAWSIG